MVTDVKAKFSNGALRPIEPLDLEEGAEVTLRIIDVAWNQRNRRFLNTRRRRKNACLAPGLTPSWRW